MELKILGGEKYLEHEGDHGEEEDGEDLFEAHRGDAGGGGSSGGGGDGGGGSSGVGGVVLSGDEGESDQSNDEEGEDLGEHFFCGFLWGLEVLFVLEIEKLLDLFIYYILMKL